jgi:hypothetical protein
MCKLYEQLTFTHFIVDSNGEAVFGSARINGKGRISNFLINGVVKQHDGSAWRELDLESADIVRKQALIAYSRIPVYHSKVSLF